jgi:hypothetical protein
MRAPHARAIRQTLLTEAEISIIEARMFRRLGVAMVCLAVFSIAGGHWAALQTVAWARMLAAYSQSTPLGVALWKTFSGEDPCSMCRAIEKGKADETRLPAVAKDMKKIDGMARREMAAAPLPREDRFSYPPIAEASLSLLPSSPPAPVPIAA